MRTIVYGAGAIGGAIGGLMQAAGLETVLICRGAQLATIRERGLTLRTPAGTLQADVPAVSHPRELRFRPDDVVMLTMKSQDTEAALHDLEAAGGGDLPIVCCQNGVENERLAARRFERVYGIVVEVSADYLQPGRVVVYSAPVYGVLDCGRYPSGRDALCEQIAAELERAGFSSRVVPDIMRWKYQKLITNLINGVSALTDEPRSHPAVRAIFRTLVAEATACYQAAGIAYASREDFEREIYARWKLDEIAGEQRFGPSTRQSLARGTPTVEVDHIHGEVVLLGKLHGVPTPVNARVRQLVQELAAKGAPPGPYGAEELAGKLGVPLPAQA
jgi:2-dehydropantoate 2-reductase